MRNSRTWARRRAPRFVLEPEVLDAWVARAAPRVESALHRLELLNRRAAAALQKVLESHGKWQSDNSLSFQIHNSVSLGDDGCPG
jgi:hypothetical protein